MRPVSLWRSAGPPALVVIGLMAVGNAVSAASAARSGVEVCQERAEAACGQGGLNLKDYSFTRGLFSQTLEVSYVTDWVQPDAEVTVTVSRPVFFLPWRVERQETRVQPEEILSL